MPRRDPYEQKGPIPEAVERKAARVLAVAYYGLHHVPGWDKRKPWGDGLAVMVQSGLATFDYEALSRLVIAAHDECVRMEVGSVAGPNGRYHVWLYFHDRQRDSTDYSKRHATIEEAIERCRTRREEYTERVDQYLFARKRKE
jgi:hypothetical protein